MQTKKSNDVVVGVFRDQSHAQAAVHELRKAGFADDHIGVARRDSTRTDETGTTKHTGETKADTGAVTGALAGLGVGGLWGIAILGGLVPGLGPVFAGGALASIVASAATGVVAGGLAGALIGLGIPEDEAEHYGEAFHAGHTVVTVHAGTRYAEAATILKRNDGHDIRTPDQPFVRSSKPRSEAMGREPRGRDLSGDRTMQLREEEMYVSKEPKTAGEAKVRKDVVTEHKQVDVPLTKEELVVERQPASGRSRDTGDLKPGEEMRIPLKEEQARVEKETVAKEDVRIGKRQVQDTERVEGDVRREKLDIKQQGESGTPQSR